MDDPTAQHNYDVTFVTSQRGKDLPVVDGYVFVSKDKERRRFCCKTKGCRATLVLKRDVHGVFYERRPQHGHPPHDVMLSSLEHRDEMRRIAGTKQPDATTRSIVMEARTSHQTTRRLSTDSRFIRRLRRGPAAPKTASDIVFDGDLSRFVLFHSQENKIVIFGDPDMVHCASSVTFISVDGTFSRCPVTHSQLVTCHAVCQNGVSFPFAFGLLQDKKSSTYTVFFSTIDSISSEMFCVNAFSRDGLTMSCDIEQGLVKTLSGKRCSVKRCNFHHMQAIWRFLSKEAVPGGIGQTTHSGGARVH